MTLAFCVTALAAGPVSAEPSPGSERTLTCTDGSVLSTTLAPGGFGTPYHVTGTTSVLVPRIATVNGVTVINHPGALVDAVDEVTCSYTDPAGAFIVVVGLLT